MLSPKMVIFLNVSLNFSFQKVEVNFLSYECGLDSVTHLCNKQNMAEVKGCPFEDGV